MKTTQQENDRQRKICEGVAARFTTDPEQLVLGGGDVASVGYLLRLLDDADRCAELESVAYGRGLYTLDKAGQAVAARNQVVECQKCGQLFSVCTGDHAAGLCPACRAPAEVRIELKGLPSLDCDSSIIATLARQSQRRIAELEAEVKHLRDQAGDWAKRLRALGR